MGSKLIKAGAALRRDCVKVYRGVNPLYPNPTYEKV